MGALGHREAVEVARAALAKLPSSDRFNLAWEGPAVLAVATRDLAADVSEALLARARERARRWLGHLATESRGLGETELRRLHAAPGAVAPLASVLPLDDCLARI